MGYVGSIEYLTGYNSDTLTTAGNAFNLSVGVGGTFKVARTISDDQSVLFVVSNSQSFASYL